MIRLRDEVACSDHHSAGCQSRIKSPPCRFVRLTLSWFNLGTSGSHIFMKAKGVTVQLYR